MLFIIIGGGGYNRVGPIRRHQLNFRTSVVGLLGNRQFSSISSVGVFDLSGSIGFLRVVVRALPELDGIRSSQQVMPEEVINMSTFFPAESGVFNHHKQEVK